MQNKIRIAFDLDGVIIDKPPLVPKSLIERLFKGTKQKILRYKIPKSKLDILIRKISHFYLFRPPLKQNIDYIRFLKNSGRYKIYIVTARYFFLKKETKLWLKKWAVNGLIDKLLINTKNEQPHFFKRRILSRIKPLIFVDDDELLANYLTCKLSKTKVFYLPAGKSLKSLKIFK